MSAPQQQQQPSEDLSAVVKRLRESKTRIQQLEEQLTKERENGKTLFDKFVELQADLSDTFGTPPQCRRRVVKTTGSKAPRQAKSPEAELKAIATKALAKAIGEGKKGQQVKDAALSTVVAVAKERFAMPALPDSVVRRIDRLMEKRGVATQV